MASPAAASTAALCSSVGAQRSRTGCRRLWDVSNSHPLSILPPFLSSRCLPHRPPHHHQRRQHVKSRLPSVATGTVALRFSRIRAAASPASPLHHPGDFGDGGGGTRSSGLLDRLRAGIAFIGSVLPGGRWWELEEIIGERKEERVGAMQKGLPMSFALGKMWKLVANERWIIYAGFASLLLAAGSGALIYLFILSWPLALSTLAICFVLAIIMIFHGRYQKKAAKSTQDVTASANEVAQEVLSLIRTVRVFGTEKQESKRYIRRLNILADICLRQSVAHGFWNLSFNFLYHSTQVVAVLIGGASMMAGYFSAEKLTKFILYSEWLIYATWRMADNWSSLMQSIGASEEVFKLMDLLPSKEFLTAGMKLQKLTGRVEFVNVSFYYPSRKTVPVLQNINLTVFPNEVVAIVGLSGSGKSTLVNLLLNLYQPTSGQILIDGFLVEDLDIKSLRERIGYVGQEPRLFRMDVRSNIRYGCTRKTNHEDVELAAKQAFVHWFILSLPYGYETLVDDDLLSGGQKQRIAIARAILRDPDILILDEATSALDAESEYYVKGLLHDVQSGSKTKRTIIVIAHRLSTIKSADRIIVMDNGRIVEMGNHSELLRNNGIYARLTERQTDTLA